VTAVDAEQGLVAAGRTPDLILMDMSCRVRVGSARRLKAEEARRRSGQSVDRRHAIDRRPRQGDGGWLATVTITKPVELPRLLEKIRAPARPFRQWLG